MSSGGPRSRRTNADGLGGKIDARRSSNQMARTAARPEATGGGVPSNSGRGGSDGEGPSSRRRTTVATANRTSVAGSPISGAGADEFCGEAPRVTMRRVAHHEGRRPRPSTPRAATGHPGAAMSRRLACPRAASGGLCAQPAHSGKRRARPHGAGPCAGLLRVRPLGFEPRTCGLRVRCSAVELEARNRPARPEPEQTSVKGDRGDSNPRHPRPQRGALT